MSTEYRQIPAGSVPTVALLLTRLQAATQLWWNRGGSFHALLASFAYGQSLSSWRAEENPSSDKTYASTLSLTLLDVL
jgi:hypothetical protein